MNDDKLDEFSELVADCSHKVYARGMVMGMVLGELAKALGQLRRNVGEVAA